MIVYSSDLRTAEVSVTRIFFLVQRTLMLTARSPPSSIRINLYYMILEVGVGGIAQSV